MPGPVRESYNAKGRQSTAGSRKKGKIRKDKSQKNEPQEDSNANILNPESKEEKETAKRKKLLEEVRTSYFFIKCS
jgi:ATP-dependent RNA helicase DHX37/DHR1